MENRCCQLDLAGRIVRYRFLRERTPAFFPAKLRPCDGETCDVFLSEAELARGRDYFPPDSPDAWVEYKLLLYPTAQHLLVSGACIVHAVALAWKDRAWLLCAPSGTGKTTQYLRWKQLGGDAVHMISGDQPVVSLEPDGTVQVWASMWTGKERWVDIPGPVPLGGIVFLEQGEVNEIRPMPPEKAVPRLIEAFACRPETEDEIRSFAALADAMLACPSWLLRNRGDLASAKTTMDAIIAEGSVDQ